MLSKEEIKQRRTSFYKQLEDAMKDQKASAGRKINWFNYPLGLKETFFRLEFDQNGARMCIDLQHRDEDIRNLFWDQWLELKAVLTSAFGDDLTWEKERVNEYQVRQSRISVGRVGLDFFNDADWKVALPFFKKNLMAWDAFWQDFQSTFDALK